MRLTVRLFVGSLAVFVVAIGAAPASASQEVERPFKATESGTITEFNIENCSFELFPTITCPQEISAVAQVTHLGRSTFNATANQVTIYLAGQPCLTPEGNQGVPFDAAGSGIFVAANGDKLNVDTFAKGCGNGVDRVETTGTYTITGGTGRFQGATGQGTLASNVVGGAITTRLAGTITY